MTRLIVFALAVLGAGAVNGDARQTDAVSAARAAVGDLALVGGGVYTTPGAARLDDAVVVVRDGRIDAVGRRGEVDVPPQARVIDVAGRTLVAGFWNSHVHFTEDVWSQAASGPAAVLADHMRAMLTKWGFTTVFDIGSDPASTLPLRRRVEQGEVPGPRILTTAGVIYPENGIPVYVPKRLADLLKPFEAATPADAARLAKMELGNGADGIKLFAGAIMGHGVVRVMPAEVARAAVTEAHAVGKPVFAHPSNHAGADSALAAGVDVLAHTIPIEEEGFTLKEIGQMKARHVALIPTLTLWEVEVEKDGGSAEDARLFALAGARGLRQYVAAEGPILFGTDVGYTPHYDTTEEFVLMGRGGMGWRDILASLTTTPAAFFKARGRGEVAAGQPADLVVLDGDPATDVRNFARVAYTIRAGRIIYQKSEAVRPSGQQPNMGRQETLGPSRGQHHARSRPLVSPSPSRRRSVSSASTRATRTRPRSSATTTGTQNMDRLGASGVTHRVPWGQGILGAAKRFF